MSKTFCQIPDNVDVMLDANVIVYALFPQVHYHNVCKQLLERGAKGEVRLYLVVNTAADVIHRSMVLELWAQGQFQRSADVVNHLKKNPETIQSIIVSVMQREKIQHLATNDADFERVPNIAVRVPG